MVAVVGLFSRGTLLAGVQAKRSPQSLWQSMSIFVCQRQMPVPQKAGVDCPSAPEGRGAAEASDSLEPIFVCQRQMVGRRSARGLRLA